MSTEVEGEIVTRRPDIVRMLRHAQSEMVPVILVFPQSHRTLSTYILEVDPDRQLLILDEPVPKTLARVLEADEPCNLETRYQQVNVRARLLRVRIVTGTDGERRYQCDFPTELYYLQRRKSFRAQARHSLYIEASIQLEEGRAVSALRDLSVTGCRLAFDGDQRATLDALKSAPFELELNFPNGSSMSLMAQLARLAFDAGTRSTDVGCQFEQLTVQVEQQLAQVVTDLQRDQINFAKNGGKKEEIPERFLLPNGDLPPVRKPVTVKANTRPEKTTSDSVPTTPIDLETLWRNALAAVRKQELISRAEPGPELSEALVRLDQAWRQQRQALMVFSRIRSPDNSTIEHRLATSLVYADHQMQTGTASENYTTWLTRALLKRVDEQDKPLMSLIQTVDRLAYKVVEQWVYYRPTAALGALHKQGSFDKYLIRRLVGTQGLYPLGSCVRLSDDHAGMVLRQDDSNKPVWVRLLYKVSDETSLPPRDVKLNADKIQAEGAADPIKLDLPVELLRPPLRD
ncbi:MAG: flagellar brake protein [Saccharospirillum sp.]|nr:flagellar brake protein [Saccharospirillum sp.]